MDQRPYGTTGAQTSIIGLGGAYLTASSFADGVATVRKALDLGISYFDTSPMYCRGVSQAVLGEGLKDRKDGYLLATKLGYFAHPARYHSPEALVTQFEENLRLLGRDHVDTLQLHEADSHHWWSTDGSIKGRLAPGVDYVFNDAPALVALRQLQKEGRCRFIGISGNSADHMTRVLSHIDVDTFLLAFNYDLIRRGARTALPQAKEKGCVSMIGAIFARGLASPHPSLLDAPPGWMTDDLAARYRTLFSLQAESGLSLAELGVRFMVGQPEMDTVIIGAKLPHEIEACVRAAERGPLPEDLLGQIEALGVG
ncbi:MAG: aldo/keto reductase [bacterium]|jgi:aryl-alcohol dehydrogenase-like predicted oxidoreductase|nr:aldo/keto reductase [bacterium]